MTALKTFIITAKAILPIRPANTVLLDQAVVVAGNQITDILPTSEVSERYPNAEVIDLSKHVLLPGFINLHNHAAMSLFRGIADDLPLMEWLSEHIWPAEGAWVNTDFVRDGSQLAIAEMLKGGTTFFSDMYFFPEETALVAEQAGIRTQLTCPLLDFPTAWGSGPDEYLEKTKKLAEKYQAHELVNIAIGPHAPYTVSDQPMQRAIALSEELDLNVQIHLHETQQEVDESLANHNRRPIERLNDLGLFSLGDRLQCVHMTALNDQDISTIADSGANVIHCPESNLKLASGFCPTAALLSSEVNVCFGTDGAASNNDLDLLGEAKTGALISKAYANDASAMSAEKVLEMLTIDAAKALRMENQIGSIEKGKLADIIAIDLDQLNTQPCYNITSNIVYSCSSNQVTHSWINGVPIMADRKLLTLDEQSIKETARSWAAKIQKAS